MARRVAMQQTLAAVEEAMMQEEYEEAAAESFDWFVRARLDVAALLPLPPAAAFVRDRVYIGGDAHPLNDQLWLVPRSAAFRAFSAVRSYYACPDTAAEWRDHFRPGLGLNEVLLWWHLHSMQPSWQPHQHRLVCLLMLRCLCPRRLHLV